MNEIPTEGFVLLTAPWCKHCPSLKQKLNKIAPFIEIDVEKTPIPHVRSVPQLYFNGERIFTGSPNFIDLKRDVERCLRKAKRDVHSQSDAGAKLRT